MLTIELNRPSDWKATSSPFQLFRWNAGNILFDYQRYDRFGNGVGELDNFQSSRRVLVAIGLINYPELGIGAMPVISKGDPSSLVIFPPEMECEGGNMIDVHLQEVMGNVTSIQYGIEWTSIAQETTTPSPPTIHACNKEDSHQYVMSKRPQSSWSGMRRVLLAQLSHLSREHSDSATVGKNGVVCSNGAANTTPTIAMGAPLHAHPASGDNRSDRISLPHIGWNSDQRRTGEDWTQCPSTTTTMQ
eukprot:gene36156-47006_t